MNAPDTAKTLASPRCYGCLGTGRIQGFGMHGAACLCVAECERCGAPIAWEHDDERAPAECDECRAIVPSEKPICFFTTLCRRCGTGSHERCINCAEVR